MSQLPFLNDCHAVSSSDVFHSFFSMMAFSFCTSESECMCTRR